MLITKARDFVVLFVLLFFSAVLTAECFEYHRRLLHQPFFPVTSQPPMLLKKPPTPQPPPHQQPQQPPRYVSTNRSSEFLYLGTIVNTRVDAAKATVSSNGGIKLGVSSPPYQNLGSPELNPLPPLPKVPAAKNPEPGGPPVLVAPSRPVVLQNNESIDNTTAETPKPKLKPLHWDKVRASSDRAMVWDQIKASSFQLNEEMIETLFTANNLNSATKENGRRQSLPSVNQENRVLDPKKSQNIAILLRALNVTIEEVCEALMEGNSDTLGTELLESLLKMAPTNEEERKLKDFTDESPFKLGPAEKFLKAVLHIPFAFKRVDAMLYIANFDSEIEYLKRSFETLEAACGELRNSKMFLKLLEAVLKTGNRMNVGTNRGDAHAFKLDTLLKLVDVKGTDGKTTLLHFVVQEIIRAEGSRLSNANQNPKAEKIQQSDLQDDVEFRKLGLEVVSGLSGELTNVKKAAAMDSDALSIDVAKLATGISKIREVIKLNEEVALKDSSRKFSESMNEFLKKAEEEIIKIPAQDRVNDLVINGIRAILNFTLSTAMSEAEWVYCDRARDNEEDNGASKVDQS
ncbi:hypothetical protein GOBAR_DD24843 [Gossypium barbadense]|nr:hypothetical protein GOBAR_DD24843 [Gossypium barbadense]